MKFGEAKRDIGPYLGDLVEEVVKRLAHLALPSSVPEAAQDAEPEHPNACSEAPVVLEVLDQRRQLAGRRCDLGRA
jgi:hypothetical protein